MRNLLKGTALAGGLALALIASPALAAYEIHLNSSSIDWSYSANINYDGVGGSVHTGAVSNGITFNVTDVLAPNANYDLFAFCIDIFHHIGVGNLGGDIYLSTFGDEPNPPLYDGSGGPALSDAQTDHITTLVDIGFLLHRDSPSAETNLQTAAIQAAIWEIEHPGSISLNNGGASATSGTTFAQYFDQYVNLNGSGSRIFTLTDVIENGETDHNQGFIVGWPPEGGVPEPATWALMIMGFGAAGVMLRRRRVAA